MASRREYEMLFKLGAQLGGNYNSTFKSAQGAIVSLQNEIQSLNKTQSDIASFQKQQAAIEANQQKLVLLQQQYDNIQKEISETGEYSSALENKLLAKQLQIEKTTGSITTQAAKLEHMGNALREAGIDTSNLTTENARLGSQIDEIKSKQEAATEEASNFGTTAAAAFGAVGQALVAAGIAAALHEIYEEYAQFVEASMAFESAMTGVAKTTDLTDQEFAMMSKEVKALSTEIPIVTEELAGIGEVAGQLGIAKNDLLDFSTVMSMLATATTMTAEEGATMLAQFANITRMDPAYYSNLASTIVALGNNYATTEQKITDMSQGIAASASLAGMSEADIVALSAAVSSLGIEAEMGSTALSKLISDLMTATETGDKLNEFASIANMSAEEFKTAWGEDAVTALQAFVVGLSDTERNGKSATIALNELGITEARMQRMILSLSNSGDLLNRTLATSNQAWTENTALVTEAEKRYATTQSQLIMMQNSYNNLKIAIGDNFTPELRELYSVANDVLKELTEFIEANPELVKGFTASVGVIGAAVTALTAYAAIVKFAIPLTAAFTATIPGLNVIMAAVVGVAALTGGIAALAEASKSARDETWQLTAVSRDQYNQLQDLNAEYKKAVEAHKEDTYETQSLEWQIKRLNAEYESGKQTLEEYCSAHEVSMRSYKDMASAHAETADEINKEEQRAIALIAKLKELATTTDSAAANKEAILSIIEALNEQVPELALNYDQVADSSEGFVDSLYDLAQAQAEQLQMEALLAEYLERAGQEKSLETALKNAEKNAELAQEENEMAKQALKEAAVSWGWFFKTIDAASDLHTAREELDAYNQAVKDTTAAYEENKARLTELDEAYQAYRKIEDIEDVIRITRVRISELSAAYEEAYNDAYESLSGQYALWDQAAEVATTSVGEINSALESQTEYWQNYNANLADLIDRSGQIEGLAEMIATFTDGSEGSVNAIAGMASATDDDLASMVANWKTLQEEQKKVAGSLADLETEFTASMDLLQTELANAIEGMDMSEEAAISGKDTIQGFIDGANYKLPAVQAAYERIAKAAIAAIDAQLEIKSPSKVFEMRGQYTMGGFIGGVTSMETDIASTMKEVAMIGTQAFSAEEKRAMSPYYAGHYSEMEYGREIQRLPLQIQANATGTTDAENIFLAGEYGPELVIGAQGSTVFPTTETQRIIKAVSEYETQHMSLAPQFAAFNNELGQYHADINIPGTPLAIQANATGTTDAENIFLAGEYGPELVIGAQGSTVFPAEEAQRIIDAVSEYKLCEQYIMGGFPDGESPIELNILNVIKEAAKPEAQTFVAEEYQAAAMAPFYAGYYNELQYDSIIQRLLPSIQATQTTFADEIFLVSKYEPELAIEAHGSTPFNAREVQQIEQIEVYRNAIGHTLDAVHAQPGGRDANPVKLTVSPVYHIEGTNNPAEIEKVLWERTQDLKDMVLEIIEDERIDKARRAYR